MDESPSALPDSRRPLRETLRLPPDSLYRRCTLTGVEFASTAELPDPPELIGQTRALDAIRLAANIEHSGFNLFVIGEPGSGKRSAVRRFLEAKAAGMPPPADWVYVNNFGDPRKPLALQLPPGQAIALRNAMDELIDDLGTLLPAAFESEDYQARRNAIEERFQERQEAAFEALGKEAEAEQIAILRTPTGFAMVPAGADGKMMKPERFNELPEAQREALEKRIAALQDKLANILKAVPGWDKERRSAVKALNRETAQAAIGQSLEELTTRFAGLPQVLEHLEVVRQDLVTHANLFIATSPEQDDSSPTPEALQGHFDRYKVNVLVGQDSGQGPGSPVIEESHPTLGNLLGRVEHVAQQGALVTNFLLVKGGALHRANGGFLLLDLRQLLTEPLSWMALKRTLRSHCIRIESAGDVLGLVPTVSLEPEPLPLNLKVVLFGDRLLYYLLAEFDPEVPELFKVVADFDDSTPWSDDSVEAYAQLLAAICRREQLRPMVRDAVARVIERCARMAGDSQRLTLRLEPLADLLREADFIAGAAGRAALSSEDVAAALEAQESRSGRLRERTLEHIVRGVAMIDSSGHRVGQVNGLSVLQLGGPAFGRPSRITARVRMGAGKVVDIEREVQLGGPLHSKGVLILSGYLAAHYAPEVPLSLAATLVFEQSYGGVDGDSASAAELFALLSALSGVALDQGLAVTGSVNQLGEVQAIGGVNEKIEGFFDVCAARGLTRQQGVIIPAANVQHLMLRADVLEACTSGRFSVYAIHSVGEGIELLTGLPAGERDARGVFPPESVNALVERRLLDFARARRSFGAAAEDTADAPRE